MNILQAQQRQSVLPSLLNNEAKNNDNAEAMLKQKMFVKVITSKNKIFVGEPIMATYKFYVVMQINDQPTVTKQPEFAGCSVKELNFEQGPELENIDNLYYAVYTIRKVQLTPLQPGKFSLGKAFVENDVQLRNPDDPYVINRYNISISNADVSVDVSPLPEKDKPENFNGITGTFNISASVTNAKIPVGENGHLIVTIHGSGNIDAINKPKILWPANTEHFDGSDSQNINKAVFPITGERVFDIPFIGKKEEAIFIPPIQFSFFNTAIENYQTVATDSIEITFTKALARKDEFTNVVNYDISNRKYLWLVPAIAFIVALIGFISYRRNKKQVQSAKPVVNITAAPVFAQPQPVYHVKYRTDFSRYLSELENIKEDKQFFSRAKELLTKAIAERVDSNQNAEQLLIDELKQRTYDAPVCNKVAALYEALNINLYAPFETETELAFYFNELKHVIEELQAEG
ncbi:MAG: BatD family protein [Parafilimonas sp.]